MRNTKRGGTRLLKKGHPKREPLCRWLSLLLSLCIVVSMLGGTVFSPALAQELGPEIEQAEPKKPREELREETREEIKTRLLRQIGKEGWDPYSADMSLDEFYALVELFQEGALPLEEEAPATVPVTDPGLAGTIAVGPDSIAAEMDGPDTGEPGIADAAEGQAGYIPRTVFLFSGLTVSNGPGTDAEDHEWGPPQEYDNSRGNGTDYPPGLDLYNIGYTRPPEGWPGVEISGETLKVFVAEDGINDDNTAIAGNVYQTLFPQYNDHYVYRITVQGNEVEVLGVIQIPRQSGYEYIYYYQTDRDQNTDVSATTLLEGQKFIIQYSPSEHSVEYVVKLDNVERDETKNDGTYSWIDGLADVTSNYRDKIFGTDLPEQTNQGEYSFTARAPDYYTLSFYLQKWDEDADGWGAPTLQLGREWGLSEETGEYQFLPGRYTGVNDGWALGEEPVYAFQDESRKQDMETFSVPVDTTQGPGTLTMNGTFYNGEVKEDRRVIAVIRYKGEPKFAVLPIQEELAGVCIGINGEKSARGTSAAEDYNWEADYAYAIGEISENPYPNRPASFPNLGSVEDPNWTWGMETSKNMTKRVNPDDSEDITYSYEWTFQTNDPGKQWYLDALEVNGVGVTVPFFPRYLWNDYDEEKQGVDPADPEEPDKNAMHAWYTETTLPDGVKIRVEYLLAFVFNSGVENPVQRHYRIKVENARSNVSITGMNLMLYSIGNPEFSIYDIDGITGATVSGGAHMEAIQYYDRGTNSDGSAVGWDRGNKYKANVVVDYYKSGIDYDSGDPYYGGANIRFKVAEGYGSPYYLYESTREGVIDSAEKAADGSRQPQASIRRDEVTGLVNLETQNQVVPFVSDGTKPWMRYNGDGVPIPVDKDGNPLYDKDGNQLTDWSAIWIREIEERIEQADGSTVIAKRRVLAPELYASPDDRSSPLSVDDVIAGEGEMVFKFEGDLNLRLKPQYIYSGADGWYYIRLTGQGWWNEDGEYVHPFVDEYSSPHGEGYKIALLTIVALPERYVVRYKPNEKEEVRDANGFVIHSAPVGEAIIRMPEYPHSDHYCLTFPLEKYDEKPKVQFDDHLGSFYDIEVNKTAAVSSVRPLAEGGYSFVDWMLVNEFDEPVLQHVIDQSGQWATDPDGNYLWEEVHFAASSTININDYSEFAILNHDLGSADIDVHVLRLVPTWEKYENAFHYTVALNWMDAAGELHEEYFHDFWDDVLTDYELDQYGLTVKVLTDAVPLRDWIAQHPTYTFWDAVNNAADNQTIQAALKAYFPADAEDGKYKTAEDALLKRDRAGSVPGDDFDRLGSYTFSVREDEGTIVIWMYEDKGGLVFHKDVDAEPFIYDDEFYFTVDSVAVGTGPLLSGEYKAYPEKADGVLRDADAWRVLFEGSRIVNIVKNDGSPWPADPVTYFTLRDGEGIMLYVPGGTYTVRELGSKSGGSYKVYVNYLDEQGNAMPEGSWDFPKGEWLRGSETTYHPEGSAFPGDGSVSQVPATVNFKLGEHEVVRTITFSNRTSTVVFEKTVKGLYEDEAFGFEAVLKLPDGALPLSDANGDYYYFNFNLYNVAYGESQTAEEKPPEPVKPDGDDPEEYEAWLAWHSWRPRGTLSSPVTGRMVVENSPEGSTTWVSRYLLVQRCDADGSPIGWTRMDDGIWLKDGQRFYVVCTVLDEGDINYSITETDRQGYHLLGTITREGKAVQAELAYELFVNSRQELLPAAGGPGVSVFYALGMAFLLSGLGLAWLKRDLWSKRGGAAQEKQSHAPPGLKGDKQFKYRKDVKK